MSWPGCGGWRAPAASATPARWTRWPPAYSCSASTRPPGCCITSCSPTRRYTATIRLGQSTRTDDAEGEVISARSAAGLTTERCAPRCRRSPVRSRRCHRGVGDQAGRAAGLRTGTGRRGRACSPPRPVTVSPLRCRPHVHPVTGDLLDVDVIVECSSGTYVRALARDLGAALGVGGHLTALRRTQGRPIQARARPRTLDELAHAGDPVTLPLADAVGPTMPVREITDERHANSPSGARYRRRSKRHVRRVRSPRTVRSSRC